MLVKFLQRLKSPQNLNLKTTIHDSDVLSSNSISTIKNSNGTAVFSRHIKYFQLQEFELQNFYGIIFFPELCIEVTSVYWSSYYELGQYSLPEIEADSFVFQTVTKNWGNFLQFVAQQSCIIVCKKVLKNFFYPFQYCQSC